MKTLAPDVVHYLSERVGLREISPLGAVVLEILDDIWALYNLRRSVTFDRADWTHQSVIRVAISRSLATYDDDALTQLVVRCHDACVRLQVEPRNRVHLNLVFSRRERTGDTYHRHPTMEDAIARVRGRTYYGRVLPEVGT